MDEIRRKAAEEKQMLMKQAQEDMKLLIEQQSRTAQVQRATSEVYRKNINH
jgi:hypothetical protein